MNIGKNRGFVNFVKELFGNGINLSESLVTTRVNHLQVHCIIVSSAGMYKGFCNDIAIMTKHKFLRYRFNRDIVDHDLTFTKI